MRKYRILIVVSIALFIVISSVYLFSSSKDSGVVDYSLDHIEYIGDDFGGSVEYVDETLKEALDSNDISMQTRPIISILEVDIDSRLGPEYYDLQEQANRSSSKVVSFYLDDATAFRFTKSGTLLKFRKRKITKPNLSSDSIVTESKMVEIANELISTGMFERDNAEGVEYDMDNTRIRRKPTYVNGSYTESGSGTFSMHIPRTYMGVGTLSSVSISVHIDTGTVMAVTNLPFYEPESMDVNISMDNAIKIASKVARKEGRYSEKHTTIKELSYVEDPVAASETSTPKSILCWVVRFEFTEPDGHIHPYQYYVDCRTGKVRGVTF